MHEIYQLPSANHLTICQKMHRDRKMSNIITKKLIMIVQTKITL